MLPFITEIAVAALIFLGLIDLLAGGKISRALFNRAKAKAGDIAERASDPLAEAAAIIARTKAKIATTKEKRRNLLQEQKKEQEELTEIQREINKWENLAKAAGGDASKSVEQRRSYVEQALIHKKAAMDDLATTTTQLSEIAKLITGHDKVIDEMEAALKTAEGDSKIIGKSLSLDKLRAENALEQLDPAIDTGMTKLREQAREARTRASVLEEEVAGSAPALEIQALYGEKAAVTPDDIDAYLPAVEVSPLTQAQA